MVSTDVNSLAGLSRATPPPRCPTPFDSSTSLSTLTSSRCKFCSHRCHFKYCEVHVRNNHRRILDPGRANPRFIASVASLRMARVAGRSPQVPYRTPSPSAACASAKLAARRPGFHAQSHTSRAVKLEVRPGRSRGQFKNAAMLNTLMEAYSAI